MLILVGRYLFYTSGLVGCRFYFVFCVFISGSFAICGLRYFLFAKLNSNVCILFVDKSTSGQSKMMVLGVAALHYNKYVTTTTQF